MIVSHDLLKFFEKSCKSVFSPETFIDIEMLVVGLVQHEIRKENLDHKGIGISDSFTQK